MLAYVTVGTNDLEAAGAFYDALLAEVGATRAMENDRLIAWTTAPGQPMFIVIKPFNGEQATVGNGNMAALAASSKEQVNALHKKALELGGADEGAPGPRGDGSMYIGYFRDLEGNKLDAFTMA